MPLYALAILFGTLVAFYGNQPQDIFWSACLPLLLLLFRFCPDYRLVCLLAVGFLWANVALHDWGPSTGSRFAFRPGYTQAPLMRSGDGQNMTVFARDLNGSLGLAYRRTDGHGRLIETDIALALTSGGDCW